MRMKKKRMLAAAVALALSGAGVNAHANDIQDSVHTKTAATENDAQTYQSDAIVVTASGFEEDVRYAPASISVITAVFEMWRTLKAKLKKEARRNRQKNL